MAHKSSSDRSLSILERLTVVTLGVYLSAVGVQAMTTGHYLYRNYLHTPVVAPIGFAIGVILIGAGLAMRH